jgi:uncharacterized caspase-like protein
MPKGVSLHIGIDEVSISHYGTAAELPNCRNDAMKMKHALSSIGFETCELFDKNATTVNLFHHLEKYAADLSPADIFILTYSGHGHILQDRNNDEREDGYDETWVLYDRMFVDDELHFLLSRFPRQTRILVISDSCHSGTITKSFGTVNNMTKKDYIELLKGESDQVYMRNKSMYDRMLKSISSRIREDVEASVILLAACQDDQKAAANSVNDEKLSLFTYHLLETWNSGVFEGNYRTLYEIIKRRMPRTQIPNYSFIGSPHPYFENQKPFTI